MQWHTGRTPCYRHESRIPSPMAYWIVKTEPSTYSYSDLQRDRKTVWDGVKNPLALKHISQMKVGDDVLIYHTGNEKAAVGQAEVVSAPYPDPKQKDPKLFVVELAARVPLPRPVTLAEIKADKTFADLALVSMGRLSVVPATAAHWKRLLQLGGANWE
jgi:predicted RNA-binding protein with PUA-like domain